MTLVAGLAPESRERAALHLAAMMARSAGEELVLCAVVPQAWPPGLARVDAEYRAYLGEAAERTIGEARERLPADIAVSASVRHARSVPTGLLAVAEELDAAAIVVGSSPAGGFGRVALGSVTDRLLHSSPIPIALAPRGYRCNTAARVTRVTAAYGGTGDADDLVLGAAGIAARVGATLRLASFAVRARPPVVAGVGRVADDTIVEEWAREIRSAAESALAAVRALPSAPGGLESVVGRGESWAEAVEDVEWDDGDVLVVGSSAIGPVARVFLGSRASKIVRRSPVPVVVVPRGAAAELADEAERAAAP